MKRDIYFNVVCIFIIIFLFGVAVVYVEIPILDAYPPQLPDDVTIEQWKTRCKIWAFVCFGVAGFASFFWYWLAQWIFKINRWEDARKRSTWTGLLILLIIIIFSRIIYVELTTESSPKWVYPLFFLNGFLPYYLTTLLFSPSSFKYTPVGAKYFRHW